jgi:hypothetical protein
MQVETIQICRTNIEGTQSSKIQTFIESIDLDHMEEQFDEDSDD